MGSFLSTCIISNLPIEAGTAVRFLALTKNAIHKDNEHCCYVTGRWLLRCPPVHGEYNDYGSVENVKTGLTSRVFFGSLSHDCVEKGVGDNIFHDVQVRVGMTDEQWLKALWESRVYVTDERLASPNGPRPEPPESVPSLARIEAVLQAHWTDVYILDEVTPGFIRVRSGKYGEEEAVLGRAMPVLQTAGYAAMITAGTGDYRDPAEMLVAARPSPKGQPRPFLQGLAKEDDEDDKRQPRPVAQAMIREDVWQILLQTSVHGYTFEDMLSAGRALLQEKLAWKAEDTAFLARFAINPVSEDERQAYMRKTLLQEMKDDGGGGENLLRRALRADFGEDVYGSNLKEALRFALELEASPEEYDEFIVDLAETVYVQWVYSMLHGQWHLSTNNGQDPHWKEHREFLTKLTAIQGQCK
jgi:hypothetical protein